MSCSSYKSNNTVLQQCYMFSSTNSELLIMLFCMIFRIKEKGFFLFFTEKAGCCICELEGKEIFWADHLRGCSLWVCVIWGCIITCPIPHVCASSRIIMQDWGAFPGFSNTSWLWGSLQRGKWKEKRLYLYASSLGGEGIFTVWSLNF